MDTPGSSTVLTRTSSSNEINDTNKPEDDKMVEMEPVVAGEKSEDLADVGAAPATSAGDAIPDGGLRAWLVVLGVRPLPPRVFQC